MIPRSRRENTSNFRSKRTLSNFNMKIWQQPVGLVFTSSWPWWVGAKVGFVCLELLLEFHWDDPQASRKKARHWKKVTQLSGTKWLGTMIHSKSGKSNMYKYRDTNHIYEGLLVKHIQTYDPLDFQADPINLIRTSNEPAQTPWYSLASTSAEIRAPSQVWCSTCGPFRPLASWTNKNVSGAHCKDEFGLVRVQLGTIRWFQYRCIKCPSKKKCQLIFFCAKISKKIEVIATSGVEWVTSCWQNKKCHLLLHQ